MIPHHVSPSTASQSKSTLVSFLWASLTSAISFAFWPSPGCSRSVSPSHVTLHLPAEMFSFPDPPCSSEFPLPDLHYPSHPLTILFQFDPQADAMIIFLKHPEHILFLIQTLQWVSDTLSTSYQTRIHTTLTPVDTVWEKGSLVLGKYCLHFSLWESPSLEPVFPKLIWAQNSPWQGTHTTTPQIQYLQNT